MNRAALIVVCPGEEGNYGELPGTKIDAMGFRDFLLSDVGGAWRTDEVQVLTNPRTAEVISARGNLILADYALVVFSGHGGTNPINDKIYFYIDGERMPQDDLVRNEKTTLIIDCCRTYPIEEGMERQASLSAVSVTNIPNARDIYDAAIAAAEPGAPIYLHAAGHNQTSTEDYRGAYYIRSLLKVAKQFGSRTDSGSDILTVQEAHCQACKFLRQEYTTATQTPTMSGSVKRQRWYPFALRNVPPPVSKARTQIERLDEIQARLVASLIGTRR